MTSDGIDERVARCVAQVLALDLVDIKPESKLMDDLGAESLDLVELMYVMETEFKLRLEQKDLSLTAQLGMSEDELHVHEVLTPKALELLREKFPSALGILKPGITRKHLAALLTVEEVANAMRRKLASKAEGTT